MALVCPTVVIDTEHTFSQQFVQVYLFNLSNIQIVHTLIYFMSRQSSSEACYFGFVSCWAAPLQAYVDKDSFDEENAKAEEAPVPQSQARMRHACRPMQLQ